MPSPADTFAARVADLDDRFDPDLDPLDRYEALLDLAREMPPFDPALRQDAFLVRGCQSKVWVVPERCTDGTLAFQADADALIPRGLAALVTGTLSGLPPAFVADADLGFLDRLGLGEHLSPTRRNGLAAMVAQVRAFARATAAPAPDPNAPDVP